MVEVMSTSPLAQRLGFFRKNLALLGCWGFTLFLAVQVTVTDAAPQIVSALTWQAATQVADEAELPDSPGLAVEVVHDGGAGWLVAALRNGVAAEPRFDLKDSAHLLRAEVVEGDRALGVRLKLARRGWELVPNEIWVASVEPWLVPLAFGLALLIASRRWWAWPLAALLSQSWLYLTTNSALWSELTGQLVQRLGAAGIALQLDHFWPQTSSSYESLALAGAAAILAVLGLAQDRRAPKSAQLKLVATVIVCGLSAMVLIEAAATSGLIAVARLPMGALALLGTLALMGFGCSGLVRRDR